MKMSDREFNELMEELGGMEFAEPIEKIAPKKEIVEKPVVEAPKKKSKTKSAINDTELRIMLVQIEGTFNDKVFKNRDLEGLLEGWGLSARQTPSRLKKLVEGGFLKDLGGSPKSYQVA